MTTGIRKTLSPLTATLWTLVLLVIVPRLAAAAPVNGVKSLRLGTHENFSRLVLAMEREPHFSVRQVGERSLLLELDNFGLQPNLNLAGIEDGRVKNLAIYGRDDRVKGLKITVARPLRQARSFWWAEGKKLGLDIYLLGDGNLESERVSAAKPQNANVIKTVRLGTHPKFSRLVIELSAKTSYELKRNSGKRLVLQVNEAVFSGNFAPTMGTDSRVSGISISSKKQGTASINIELAAPAARLKHFWLEEGNRLVLDIYGSTGKTERQNSGTSGKVAKTQEQKSSISKGEEQTTEADNPGKPAADTSPLVEKENLKAASISARATTADEKSGIAAGTSSASVALGGVGEERESGSGDTPETVLEELIPSLEPEAADLLREIIAASRAKRANRALKLVARYGKQFHDRAAEPLQLLRGDLYFQLGLQGASESFAEAADVYQEAIVLGGKSPLRAWTLVQLGRIQLRRKRYLEALGYLDLLLENNWDSPHRAAALVYRGWVYLEKDRADLALGDFQEVVSLYPASPYIEEALMGKAVCLSQRGERRRADELFADLENRNPGFHLKHPEILYYRGRNDLDLGRFWQGREKLLLALNVGQQPQDSPLLLAHIADSFRSQGMTERAASYYRLTMKLFPNSEGAVVSRARLAEETGKVELLEEIVDGHPQSEMAEFALVKMAGYYHAKGDYREAIRTLQRLEREYPTSSLQVEGRRLLRRSLNKRASQLREQGDYWELLFLLKTVKFLLSDRYRLKAAIWEAEACAKLSLWEDAVAALESITPDDLEEPDRLQWTLILAQAYEARGQQALAESLLRRMANATSSGKFAGELKWQLAHLYQKAGNHEEALAAYRKLLDGGLAGAARSEALVATGKSFLALKEYGKAKDTYKLALSQPLGENQPDGWRSAAWSELGEIHFREQRFQLAARAFEKALQYGKDSTRAMGLRQRSRLAACYEKLGAHAKAKHLYQRLEKEESDLWRQMASVSQRVQELQARMAEVRSPDG